VTQADDAFAPWDPTDGGRSLFEWESRYGPSARKGIAIEALYVIVMLIASAVLIFLVWLGTPRGWLRLDPERYVVLSRFAYAGLGGVFGASLIDLKWLYHFVARGRWHLDRRLWRLCVPLIGGGLAVTFFTLVRAGGYGMIQPRITDSGYWVLALGILVGLFSDSALAKLAEVAEALFGGTKHTPSASSESPPSAEAPESER